MTRSSLPIALFSLACAAFVTAYGLLSPINNWDLVGYTASALRNTGLTGEALHQMTYADLSRALPPERFADLTTGGPYGRGVFADSEALEQQLPFYRIRVLYLLLIQTVAQNTGSLTQATWIVSATSAGLLCLLTGAMLHINMRPLHWLATATALVLTLYVSSVVLVSRLSTPDALFAFGALSALALFYRARTAAMTLVAILPLIRTDAIVLSALLMVLLLTERDRDWRHYTALAISAALYVAVNAAYGNYSHAVLFNFTLIAGQRTPYPELLQIVRDPAVYLQVYLDRGAGMFAQWSTWILLATAITLAIDRARSGRIGPMGRLALVGIAYVLLHFLALPLGVARHYVFALIVCCVYISHFVAVSATRSIQIPLQSR